MTSFFKPKTPTPKQETALPQADDEEIRRAKTRKIAEANMGAGTQLTESKLGDFAQATVRTGAAPKSTIVSGV